MPVMHELPRFVQLERIDPIEIGPDARALRRFRRLYLLARSIFTLVILLVIAACIYAGILAILFGGAFMGPLWALQMFLAVAGLIRLAILGR